jgi:hypothetical protein
MGLINGADVTQVWDNTATASTGGQAPHQLGEIARIPGTDGSGDRYYVFVHNDTASAIDYGHVAAIVAAGGWSVTGTVLLNADKATLAGVVQRSAGLPADHYGWVQCWGPGVATADATGWVAGNLLVVDANGETDVITATTDNVIAVARASATATEGAVDIVIRTA